MTRLALFALLAACKHDAGEACDDSSDCSSGYVCHQQICMTTAQRDKDLRAQSGVAEAPVERPIAGGDHVHVRTARGDGMAFAVCGATERMIGGGCSGGNDCGESGCSYLRSYPNYYTDDDTLGARWYCSGPSGLVQAYALCQDTRVPAAGSGSSNPGSGLRAP